MARDAADRFPTAREMAEELKRFQTGQLVASHRYSTGELIRRWLRQHRGIAATVAVALVVTVVGTVGFLSRERTLRMSAIHSRDDARRALAQNMLEQGRRELMAARPARAAPFVAAAYVS